MQGDFRLKNFQNIFNDNNEFWISCHLTYWLINNNSSLCEIFCLQFPLEIDIIIIRKKKDVR